MKKPDAKIEWLPLTDNKRRPVGVISKELDEYIAKVVDVALDAIARDISEDLINA